MEFMNKAILYVKQYQSYHIYRYIYLYLSIGINLRRTRRFNSQNIFMHNTRIDHIQLKISQGTLPRIFPFLPTTIFVSYAKLLLTEARPFFTH